MERESRIAKSKLQHPQLLPRTVNSASDVNSCVTAPSYHTVLNVELEVTSQQSVLPNNRIIDGRMKDAEVLMKDAKLKEKIGRNYRPDHSSPTRPANALTLLVITELGSVRIDNNHKHLPLATQLMVQVFTEIVHSLTIILPNNIHNKVHPP